VKLSGSDNYVSWARHCKLILSSHGYESLLAAAYDEEEKNDAANRV
jgi:hypothetical protein